MKTKQPATYADIEELPETQLGELIDGVLYASPRPASRHAFTASALGAELHGPFQRGRGGPGGWWVVFEPELHFGADVLVPDLAAWRRERMPDYPDCAYFSLAPDWVGEVLSPSTARVDVALELPKYARAGVQYAWIIDPVGCVVEVFHQQAGRWGLLATHRDVERVRAAPFEAVEIELEALWAPTGTRVALGAPGVCRRCDAPARGTQLSSSPSIPGAE